MIVDWSEAPEGTTHFIHGVGGRWWIKDLGGDNYEFWKKTGAIGGYGKKGLEKSLIVMKLSRWTNLL